MKYLLLILLAGSVFADICTITGYVTYEDGTNAKRGTVVTITDSHYNVSYKTTTGGHDWPFPNFYVQTLTCIFNDTITIESETVSEKIVFDHYPYQMNLTIPNVPFVEQPLHRIMEQETRHNNMTVIISYILTILSFIAILFLYNNR